MEQVFDALNHHSTTRSDAIAFEDDLGQISWHALAARVEGLACKLDTTEGIIGIGLAGGIDYVVADLAVTLNGRRQVPLPFFFSTAQNAHVLMDAKVSTIITSSPELFAALPHLNLIDPVANTGQPLRPYLGGAERVIYTSGSSGNPKGVVLGDRQLGASITALSRVIAADATDTHLSILPLAQLLEQICGVFLPIVAGAKTIFRFEATKSLFGAPIEPLVEAFDTLCPTTSLLAPAILGRWVDALHTQKALAPESLRFVAVGGASSSPSLINAAQDIGIPVHEGYGLSECCAVVAMNRPGNNHAGTVGPILDGLDVSLVEGEIVIAGPTIMSGYLNGVPAPDVWHTGDLGHFDGNQLVIDGRKDALLVTGAGRNISPEWVEQRINADPRVVSSALNIRQPDGALVLIVVAVAQISSCEIEGYLADLPFYARPMHLIITDPSEKGLLFPAGTPNRSVAATLINTRKAQPLELRTESIA